MEEKLSDQELVRREKVQKLLDLGIDPFGHAYERTSYSLDIQKTVSDFLLEEGITSIDPNDKSEEHKKFLYYCTY